MLSASMLRHFSMAVLITGLVLSSTALRGADSAPFDPRLFQDMQWRSIGPYRGGRVTAVAGHPDQPLSYYFGATGGGLWKTTNGGISWNNLSDGFLTSGTIGAIAVAESDPNVIYAGTGESPVRGVTTSHGDGVYKSTDGGKTWTRLGLEKTRQISKIVIHPQNPQVVFVGAQGSPWAPTQERGVYRSSDGGESWEQSLFVNETTGVSFLSMDMSNPRVVYAGLWDHQREPWNVRSGGPGSGLYKTNDSGKTWRRLSAGLPALMGNTGISVSRADPNRVYAMIEAVDGGVYRSDDGGESWSRVNDDPGIRDRGWYYTHIFADPENVDTLYVLAAAMVRSTDGGRSFEEIKTPHGDNHDLWINPRDGDMMVQGNDGGANVSFDRGASWSGQDNQPTAQFYRVIADNRFPYNLYAGQQDNSSVRIASRSSGAGIGPRDWSPSAGGESAHIAFDPDNPVLVYGTSLLGTIEEFNTLTDEHRSITAYPYFAGFRPGRELKYRFNWNAPVLVSRHDPTVIYHAAQLLLKSNNRGRSWVEISPDLTRDDPARQGTTGGPIMIEGAGGEHYATIMYVAESPQDANTLWVGSDDGLIHITRDGGENWSDVTPRRMLEAQVNAIEISPHDPAVAYAAATRYKFNDFSPMIYRTADFGRSWTSIVAGIPAEAFVRVVREDPQRRGLLYAGTEAGVWVSFNHGDHWQSLQLNLPLVPVTDLRVHADDLIAATQGRAFWILDDLSALHQLDGALSAFALLQPRPVYRVPSRSGPPGTGQNPPDGALLYYLLPGTPADSAELKLEILDSAGKRIRRFDTQAAAKAPATLVKGVRKPEPDRPLTTKPGMNRYVWDLRYAAYTEVSDTIRYVSQVPPRVRPGTYLLRLTHDGEVRERTLQVLSDPRLPRVAEGDWESRERLLVTLMDLVNDVHGATNRARSVTAQVRSLMGLTGSHPQAAEIAASAKRLIERLVQWENHVPQSELPGNVQDRIAYPSRLLSTQILHVIDSLDQEPPVTDAVAERVTQLSAEWGSIRDRLEGIFSAELREFEALLKALDLDHVIVAD